MGIPAGPSATETPEARGCLRLRQSWFGWRNAGRRNRLPWTAHIILKTQRCRSRMKPSMAISMGYPLTPSSAPSPGTSGGGIASAAPQAPALLPRRPGDGELLMPGQPKWRHAPCRGIGKATCSSAMPTRQRWGRSSNAPPGLPCWSR